jgi:hypothetical protein
MTRGSLLAIGGIVLAAVLALGAAPERGETGRYQLLESHYKFLSVNGNGEVLQALFRIDTVTGNVDRLEVVPIGQATRYHWQRISESLRQPQ